MSNFRKEPKSFYYDTNRAQYRFLRIPGYIIEAKLEIPKYHPHGLWWLSYFVDIVEGKKLSEIISSPIWPNPKDDLITTQLINEMIDEGLIEVNWEKGMIKTSPKLTSLYKKKGKKALISQFLEFETIKGQWWIDAVGGTLLSRQSALSYDVDFSKSIPTNCLELEPIIQEHEIEDYLSVNFSKLISLLGISKLAGIDLDSDRSFRKYASLSSPFTVSLKKTIQFELYGKHQKDSFRILPKNLMDLEPMLYQQVPHIFGKKIRHKPKIVRFSNSDIEKFALMLEKFPADITDFRSKAQFSDNIEYLLQKTRKEDIWLQWYTNGHYIEPVVGNADVHFDVLYDMLAGNWKIQLDFEKPNFLGKPRFAVLTSSFLNSNNLFPEDGLLDVLKAISKIPDIEKIVIIYGHANDDTPDQQETDINSYLTTIFTEIPDLRQHLLLVPAKKRSHEKIFAFSNGAWMLGSWNATSSRPNSNQLESSVRGVSASFTKKLLDQIEQNCENPEALQILQVMKELLQKNIILEEKQKKERSKTAKTLYELTIKYLSLLQSISLKVNIDEPSEEMIRDFSSIITVLRYLTLSFLKKARITLINEHQSRDLFISHTRKTTAEMFLASDRINNSALDSGFLKDFLLHQPEKKKTLRILWGREWEHESNISKDSRAQLKEATLVMEKIEGVLGSQLLSKSHPMENHAKFALFDGAHGLITSENILGYGGEKDKYESRELGIFVESIPAIRFIHGRAMEHRLPYFNADLTHNSVTNRPYEWICEGIDKYYALEAIKEDIDFDFSETEMIKNAILDGYNPNSQFQSSELDEFDKNTLYQINKSLEKRKSLFHGDIFTVFQKLGQMYYLLRPIIEHFSNKSWIPYNYSFKKKDFALIETIGEDLKSKYQKSKKIGEEQSILGNCFDKSKSLNSIKATNSKFPIITEIMNDMILIKKGNFFMGNNEVRDESPRHKVILTQDFYIGKYPVTQKIWRDVMGSLPSLQKNERNDNAPIIYVSFDDAQKFLMKLNQFAGSNSFMLPTEAQWEYACRAGTTTEYYFGNNPGRNKTAGLLEEFAWTKRNSGQTLREVGLKKPNSWGLYDMHGLVYEHLRDHKRRYTNKEVRDPVGPLTTNMTGCRGGCWKRFPINTQNKKWNEHFRSSCRTDHPKYEKSYRTGFRIIRMRINKN